MLPTQIWRVRRGRDSEKIVYQITVPSVGGLKLDWIPLQSGLSSLSWDMLYFMVTGWSCHRGQQARHTCTSALKKASSVETSKQTLQKGHALPQCQQIFGHNFKEQWQTFETAYQHHVCAGAMCHVTTCFGGRLWRNSTLLSPACPAVLVTQRSGLMRVLSSEWTHHAPLPAFTHLSPHVFPWRLAHFIFYMMNVSLNLLWRLSELLLYHRFQPRRDSSNGNYRGICCITKHIPCWGFHMYTAFLFRDQHLRKIHLFVLIYSILQLQQPLQLFHLCIERGLYE